MHIAIIMDGNRRWAKRYHRTVKAGHEAGSTNIQRIADYAANHGVSYLTLFAFSTENWQRDPEEVHDLMNILNQGLAKVGKSLQRYNFKVIGRRDRLSANTQAQLAKLERNDLDALTVVIAFDYGGQDEILRAVSQSNGEPHQFLEALDTFSLPDVDLVIRTGGEQRISNFLLWKAAYAELYFTDILWPDFDEQAFQEALAEFATRKRRYGGN